MRLKVTLVLFELGILGMGLPSLAEDSGKQPVQKTTSERMSFAAGGLIRLDHSYGDLRVEGWDQPEVEISVIKSMPYDRKSTQPNEAAKHLDDVTIVTERKSSAELVISTNLPRRRTLLSPFSPHKTNGGVSVEYEIHAPRNSKLVIHHGAGSVFVNDISGDIEATCGRGDIMLKLRDTGSYRIDAQNKFGIVTSDFPGTLRLRRYRVGERYATADSTSSPRLHLRMGFGGITIKAVSPEAFAPKSTE